jgi:hypothetical protein
MGCTSTRRLGLMAVLVLLTAVFGMNFVSAQIIRPPQTKSPFRPPIVNPNIPKPGFPGGGNTTVYTCSNCGRQVSESSLSCPFCNARFNNVGPDGKPIDGLGQRPPFQGGARPGFPQQPPNQQVQVPQNVHFIPAPQATESIPASIIAIVVGVLVVFGIGLTVLIYFLCRSSSYDDRRERSRSRRGREFAA